MTLRNQRGGTFLGFIIGLVLGLGLALAVAIYVTKMPTPFSNKNQPRTNEQDVQETEKNKDWNPNSVLQPKAPAEAPVQPDATSPTANTTSPAPSTSTGNSVLLPAVTADPLGDLAKAQSEQKKPAAQTDDGGPFVYMVQAGAYRNSADADAQKVKLTLLGMDAKVSERDQAGRVVYRVRVGPFSDKNQAEQVRVQLQNSGIDNTLVRIQR